MSDFSQKVLLALLTFFLTTVVANILVHRWQARNWMAQQRFIGLEKEYVALKELIEELGRLLGTRIYHMQRLAFALRSSDDEAIDSRVKDHDEVVKQWNERLASFYVRLPLLVEGGLGNRLEREFQEPFAGLSRKLDQIRRKSPESRGTELKEALAALNRVQGRAVEFNKELVRIVGRRRNEIYFGEYVAYARHNLHQYSNSELIKALFVAHVDSHAVLRPPVDSR